MSLRVWLPLNGDLHNQGLSNVTVTDNGATVNTSGKIGSCYEFNNSKNISLTDYVAEFLTYTNWSISLWFKCTAQNTAHTGSALISSGNWNQATQLLQFSLGYFSSDHYTKLLITNANNWSNGYSYNFYLNTWYHVVLVSGNNKMSAYVNGELIGDSFSAYTPVSSAQSYVGIGKATYTTVMPFYGLMNDVRIYDHALSALEIKEIARGLILHYPLNHNGLGRENLALNTRILTPASAKTNLNMSTRGAATRQLRSDGFYESKCTASWQGLSFWENQLNLTIGTKITYSFYIYGNGSSRNFSFYPMMFNSAGTRDTSTKLPISLDGGTFTTVNSKAFTPTTTTVPERHYVTFEWNQAMADIITNGGSIELSIQVHGTWNSGDWVCLFAPKIEIGESPTCWSPNSTELGIDTNIEYDISGYCNNGTKIGTFTYSTDTPKYRVSINFPGSTSCIKVNENNVMAQYAQAMTINLWAKASSWAANTHFFSCTESGGFNTEAGNSGYLRFPIYVCTNAAQTSYSYKYDSQEIQLSALPTDEWVMLTWIYDTTGTRTYINGQLHHTYNNASYGIRFNTNARLFLGCEASGANPTTPYFNGQMSDFRMYYTALSAQDILSLYHNSALVDEQGIIHGAIH